METSQPPSDQKVPKDGPGAAGHPVRIEQAVNVLLARQAKKLNMTKSQYASLSVRYFAENGLDPREAGVALENAKTRQKVHDVGYDVRKLMTDMANRFIGIQRGVERELFRFMEAEHAVTMSYLANIERNILDHQVAVDTKVLTPILKHLVGGNVETHFVRVLIEILLLKTKEPRHSVEELRGTTVEYDRQLETRRGPEVRHVLESASVPAPKLTTVPPAPKPILGTNTNATAAPPATKPTQPKP